MLQEKELYGIKVVESGFREPTDEILNNQPFYLNTNESVINNLKKYVSVLPVFSWTNSDKQLYSIFPPDVVRIGFTENNFIANLPCPQTVSSIDLEKLKIGKLNYEVSVRGVRGFLNTTKIGDIVGQIRIIVSVWFTAESTLQTLFDLLEEIPPNDFKEKILSRFPIGKDNAIIIDTINNEDNTEILSFLYGEIPNLFPKNFKDKDTFLKTISQEKLDTLKINNFNTSINIKTKVGNIIKGDPVFAPLIVELVNIFAGNIFSKDQLLSWNLFLGEQKDVDKQEYLKHIQKYGANEISVPTESQSIYTDTGKFEVDKKLEKTVIQIVQSINNELEKEVSGNILSVVFCNDCKCNCCDDCCGKCCCDGCCNRGIEDEAITENIREINNSLLTAFTDAINL